MRIRSSRAFLVASVAAVTTISLAGPAVAHDGGDGDFDIQEAVDEAEPGDTVDIPSGTYEQNVTITTDGISLRGHDVVLRPGNAPEPTECDYGDEARISGICIFGEVVFPPEDDPTGEIEVVDAVEDVTIHGITVEGFTGDGLVGLGTEELSVHDGTFRDNDGYGAASFATHGVTFHDNAAVGNDEAGFYIGDSPDAQADVRGNYSKDNEIGLFFRHASNGDAKHNVAEENCIGLLVLADAPGPATDWTIRDNEVNENNRVCEPVEDIPPLSGAGIVLSGASDIEVRDNEVKDNDSDAESAFEGGIVALVGFGGTEPSGITVEGNRATGNDPYDLDLAAAADYEADDNRCDTSNPDGLCD
jgi:hypothetical protein